MEKISVEVTFIIIDFSGKCTTNIDLCFRPGNNEWLCSHCSLTFTSASVLNLHTLAHAADNLEETEIITGLPSDFHSVYHAGEFLVQSGDVQCPQCTQVSSLALRFCNCVM